MNKDGNQVVFDEEASYVLHKSTGTIIPIQYIDNKFILKLWVKKAEGIKGCSKSCKACNHTGQFHALMESDGEQDFIRLGEDWV